MSDKQAQAARDNELSSRTVYRKPVLREFGSVGMLTQAGSAPLTELMLNMMSSMNPNRDKA